jgi:hypothetical protein
MAGQSQELHVNTLVVTGPILSSVRSSSRTAFLGLPGGPYVDTSVGLPRPRQRFFARCGRESLSIFLLEITDLPQTELLDEFANAGKVSERASLTHTSQFDQDAIGFKNASFTWSNDNADATLTQSRRWFTLSVHGELLFKPGRFNLIIGPTGSGKTSLLMALLGEMHFVPMSPDSWYHLPRVDGVSYAAQESWVQNETIRVRTTKVLALVLFDSK